jgi:hypothetical protein
VTGSSIVTQNSQTTAGAMSYHGAVTANTTGIFTNTGAGGIFFSSTLTSTNIPITLSAPNTTIEVVGTTTTSGSGAGLIGRALNVSAGDDATFGAINAVGGSGANGGHVSISSTNGSVSVGSINTSGSTGGNGGEITLQPASGFTSGFFGHLPDGKILLNGNLTASGGSTGNIYLAPTGRMDGLSIASITSSLVGNNITINGASLTIGSLEAFTILGDLTVSTSGAISVGDIVSLETIDLTGGSITLNARGSTLLLDYLGQLSVSSESHLIGRSSVDLNSGSQMINGHVLTFPSIPSNEFKTYLVYVSSLADVPTSLILNFDNGSSPPPPPPPSPPSPSPASSLSAPLVFVMPLIIANTELEENLPGPWHRSFLPPWEERKIFKKEEP